MATPLSESNGDFIPSPSPSPSYPPVFSPTAIVKSNVSSIRTFSFENGGNDSMNREELKHVEAIVYERYIRDLKGRSNWYDRGDQDYIIAKYKCMIGQCDI